MELFVRYKAVVYLSEAAYKELEGSTILNNQPAPIDIDAIKTCIKETLLNQTPYQDAIEIEIDITNINKL